jgi:DNA-binding response OmpR family regulator
MLGQTLPCMLLIDADVMQQQIVARLLYTRYKVVWCSSLADAYGLLARHHPRFVLIDIDRPSENPFQWIQDRRKHHELSGVPLICVSASSSVANKIMAFQMGADDFLVKPFAPQAFLARMELLIRAVAL